MQLCCCKSSCKPRLAVASETGVTRSICGFRIPGMRQEGSLGSEEQHIIVGSFSCSVALRHGAGEQRRWPFSVSGPDLYILSVEPLLDCSGEIGMHSE